MEKNNTYMSLYEYLGRAAGSDLGNQVFEAVKKTKEFIKIDSKEVDTPYYKGKVLTYPKWYLDAYFEMCDDEKSQPITMEEMNQLHDEWWASLSNEDKEKLYNEMAESEIQHYSNKADQ